MQKLITAFKYLTIWCRLTSLPPSPEAIGRAAIFFPLVGLILGLLLALMNYLLAPYLDSEILSVALVAALILATGGVHLDGLKQTFDPNSTLSPRTPGNSTLGLAVIVLLILFKTAAANSIDERLSLSLLLMPVLARWSLVVFIFGCQDRCDDAARATAAGLGVWQLIVVTGATLGLVFYLLGRRGLLISFFLSVFVLLLRSLFYRRQGFLSHANFGAVIELGEAFSLVLLASL